MAEDDKNKVTSLPPPPTDEIDDEWGSSSSPRSERPPSVKSAAKPETKAAKAAPSRDEEDDEDEDEDEEADDEEADDNEEADDDEEADEDEDEEEDDAQARRTRARQAAAKRAAAEASQDWLPDWAPWATLGGLLSIGFLGGVGIIPISFNLKQASAEATPVTTTSAKPASSAPKRAPSARRPTPNAPGAADQERVSASHLLVSYKGSLKAASTVTRSKEEAKKRAQEALAKAKKGEKFEKLVADFSDEPGAAARGGKLGTFPRQAMVKPFADAAFALKPGQLSDVVETDFGFHVILRTQ